MKKITIVGAGRVGETTAHNLARQELAHEVVLIDVKEGVAAGAALDIQEAAPIFGFDTKLTGHTEMAAVADSDVVVVTAGFPRKPGMSRSDVVNDNVPIISSIVDEIVAKAPDAILIIVTNPVDVMTYVAWKRTGWERRRVFGLAGVLDSTRMASFVAMETGFSVKDINAMVLGSHGDAMVPMPRYTCINGIPISQFLDEDQIERIVERARNGGAEILALKQVASAYEAPAAAIASMVSAVCRDRKHILPCVAVLEGEYGYKDICMGVPSILGEGGLEKVIELPLTDTEASQFKKSAEAVRTDLSAIKLD